MAHPNAGDKTIVVGLDDSTPGQIYIYVGDKTDAGNPVERAGLQGGQLFGVWPGVPGDRRRRRDNILPVWLTGGARRRCRLAPT